MSTLPLRGGEFLPSTPRPAALMTPLPSSSTTPLSSSSSLSSSSVSPLVDGRPEAAATPTNHNPPASGLSPNNIHARSPGNSPARKRKLDLSNVQGISAKRRKLCENRFTRLRQVTNGYRDNIAEAFFLDSFLNVTDLPMFRRRPSSQFLAYIKQKDAPPRVISEVETAVLGPQLPGHPGGGGAVPLLSNPRPPHSYSPRVSSLSPVKVGQHLDVFCQRSSASRPSPQSSIPPPTAPTYSMHQIQERIKQEGWVLRRVVELSRDGLWPDKRLPKVAEQPRPVTAWDQVLDEMRWMSADFQQERLWKRSAARLHAAVVQDFVWRKQEAAEEERIRLLSGQHHRQIAASIADQVKGFWRKVSDLYAYELRKRRSLLTQQLVARQLDHLSEVTTNSSATAVGNNSLAELQSQSQPEESGGPPCENGVSSGGEEEEEVVDEDDCSTLDEQEDYEASNVVSDEELRDLEEDMRTELATLLRINYPGVSFEYEQMLTDQLELDYYAEFDSEEEDDDEDDAGQKESYDSCVSLDSLRQLLDVSNNSGGGVLKDRTRNSGPATVKSNGDVGSTVPHATTAWKQDLMDLSETAESLLPKSVILSSGQQQFSLLRKLLHGTLLEFQLVALDWLAALHVQRLPAILADEPGLGRRVVVVAFIAHLVFQLCRPGPHLVVCPLSASPRWEAVLRSWLPALRVVVYAGSAAERRRLRQEMSAAGTFSGLPVEQNGVEGSKAPHLVLVSYATFFSDAAWFLGRRWGEAVLAEAQNVVAAGTPAQLAALCELMADNRLLIMSGPQKENPIDLWAMLRLLFPVAHELHADLAAVVEGTVEYCERVRRLQRLLTGFTLARSRCRQPLLERQLPPLAEVPIYLTMTGRQRCLYDDYLAKPETKELLHEGDVSGVRQVVQDLRRICNSAHLFSPTTPHRKEQASLPAWSRLHPRPARLLEKMMEPKPLDSVSFENINLVFLKQELTTTVLTSARLRSIKASRALITELASTSHSDTGQEESLPNRHWPPPVPAAKIRFQIEAISRTAGGWNIPGGWSEGMGLVRTASGQVFKVCTSPATRTAAEKELAVCEKEARGGSSEAWLAESLVTTAEVNHWRCSGFPLYGQDLIQSLELTSLVRPARSRFGGQGYINCLNAPQTAAPDEPDDWKYTVSHLRPLVNVAGQKVAALVELFHSPRIAGRRLDPRMDSAKLQSLDKILVERMKERFALVTSMLEMVPLLQTYCSIHSFRYVVVSSETDHLERVGQLERFSMDPRYTILILAGLDSLAGHPLPPVGNVVYLDWRPGEKDLIPRTCSPHPQTLYRLICRGTVEDAVSRKVVQRRILADLEQAPQVKQQTIQELLYPQLNDYGCLWPADRKRKEKVREDTDEREAQIQLFRLLGGVAAGQPACSLLDLAELDTADMEQDPNYQEDPHLMGFLEEVPPLQRFGMKQLQNCYELRDPTAWQISSTPTSVCNSSLEKRKLDWESERVQQELKRQRFEHSSRHLITYPSQLAGREWKAPGQQHKLEVWRPGMAFSQLEDIHVDLAAALLYRTDIMREEDLPPVHVKKERKAARDLGATTLSGVANVASPPPTSLTTTMSSSGFHPLSPVTEAGKPKVRRTEDGGSALLAPKSLFDRPRPLKALVRPRPGSGVLGSGGVATVAGMLVPTASAAGTVSSVAGVAAGSSGAVGQMAQQTTAAPATTGLLLQHQQAGGTATTTMKVAGLVAGGLAVGGGAVMTAAAASDTAGPEWLIQEDWALHQAVLVLQEMPLSLAGTSPAQIANWDLVADMVNSVSKFFRSPRQCRHRYEATILPREEGRLMYSDMVTSSVASTSVTTPVKGLKKQKQLGQLKQGAGVTKIEKTLTRPVKTSVLFRQDNYHSCSTQFSSRFETIKAITNKRTPTTKPLLVNPTLRNPKHAAVLSESGISYDSPLSPVHVAANRAERIQREKQRSAAAVAAANAVAAGQQQQQSVVQVPQQQPAQQQVIQQQQQQPQAVVGQPTRVTVASIAGATPLAAALGNATLSQGTPAQAVVVGISQPVVQQQQQQLAQVVAASVGQVAAARSPAIVTQAVVSMPSGVLSGLTAGTTATVTRLAGGQIVVSQAGGKPGTSQSAAATTTLQVASRQITPAQLQVLKQQALLKRNLQEQQLRQKLTLQQQQPGQQQQQQIVGSLVTAGGQATGVARAVVGAPTTAATVGVGRSGTVVAGTATGSHQIVRPNFRSMTEQEIKAMLSKQQLKVTGPGMVQVQPGTQLSTAQLQQLGLQVAAATGQPSSSSGTLVKTVTSVVAAAGAGGPNKQQQVTIPLAGLTGVNLQGGQLKAVAAVSRGGAAGTSQQQQTTQQQQLQQLRQLQLLRKPGGQTVAGLPQKVLQQVGGGKLPAQLIVQGQQGKGLPATVTVQQLQQIVKSVAAGGGQGQLQIGTVSGTGQQIISHAVIKPGGVVTATGAGGQTVQARVIPVSGVAGRGGQQQHTIQVVAAPMGTGGRASATVPSMTLDALSRTPGGAASALVSALAAGNHVKIAAPGGAATQQILNQVTAALAGHSGQPVSVAVRTPVSVATSMHQQQMHSQQQQHLQQLQQLQPTARLVAAGNQQQQLPQTQQVVNLQLSVAPAATAGSNSAPASNNTQQPE